MTRTNHTRRALLAAGLLAGVHAAPARSSARYPSQPVRVVVPFAPGGATDIVARMLAEQLAQRLGQPFVVENRPGASGIIGQQAVAGARPDGHVLLLTGNGPHAVNAALFRRLPYDPLRDFAQVSVTGVLPLVLNVHPSVAVRDVDGFARWARTRPGAIAYASPGVATPPHLSMELFAQRMGLSLVHVPYKGSAPAIADLVAGHVPVMFDNVFASMANIRAGRIRPLAVGSSARLAGLPEVPTFSESGLPGFEVATWTALAAPAGTPPEIVATLSSEVRRVFALPEIQARLREQGAEPVATTPEQTERFVRDEIARWTAVVDAAKIERVDG